MGQQTYRISESKNAFVKALLQDVSALERMLRENMFETDIIRIGAEQEVVLIDKETYRPSLLGPQVLEKTTHESWLVSELAKFNLELNLSPQVFTGSCLRDMEEELSNHLSKLRAYLSSYEVDYILTGILPTLHKYHLDIANLTPKQRYKDLMEAISSQLYRREFELRLVGIDELCVRHDSPLLEACNTSFQVHLQVTPQEFQRYYNFALALTAPCISLAANSPVVFGKRLWHETRIALFQQAIDTRRTMDHMRQLSPRVILGDSWLQGDVTQIFKDDIARFKILLHADMQEDSIQSLGEGRIPKLKSLQLHNSTVYRWNRPCYGISDTGKPHLRIENRVLPSGPTVLDEMANTAFWLGAMKGIASQYDDIRKHMSYADVRDNFAKSARFGMDTKFNWIGDTKVNVKELLEEELIPLAREGLQSMEVNDEDISRYLDVVTERVQAQMNGARWMLRSYTKLKDQTSSDDEALACLTSSIYHHQNQSDFPIHQWPEADTTHGRHYDIDSLRVSELMEINIFSASPDDMVELVAKLMSWKDISYMPVENQEGQLIGLVAASMLLDALSSHIAKSSNETLLVKDVMIEDPSTIAPDVYIKEASTLMKNLEVACVPDVKNKELLGILTKDHIADLTLRLLQN